MKKQFSNPEAGKTGKDLLEYMQKNKLGVIDVVVKTKVSPSYLTTILKLRSQFVIKKNLYSRLKKGLSGF